MECEVEVERREMEEVKLVVDIMVSIYFFLFMCLIAK